jgi:hypothetical protein
MITGKIDLWNNDYGVWYDRIVIWAEAWRQRWNDAIPCAV